MRFMDAKDNHDRNKGTQNVHALAITAVPSWKPVPRFSACKLVSRLKIDYPVHGGSLGKYR